MENRVGIVKADLAWDSAVVAADGSLLGGTVVREDWGGSAVEVVSLPLGPGGAPFTRYGNAPVTLLSGLAFAVLSIAMIVVARRRR